MRHPTDFADAGPRATEVWLKLLRAMTPGERLMSALELSGFALAMSEVGVRSLYPHASDREVLLRRAARYLPRDLIIRAYGWDPEIDASPR